MAMPTTRPPGYPDTPELDRMIAVSRDSQAIGQFLDWLLVGPPGPELVLARYVYDGDGTDELVPEMVSIESLLARYYKIDLAKVEAERRLVLDYVRANTSLAGQQ